MKYEEIPGCEAYRATQENKFGQMRRIDGSRPLVLFLDGNNMTKRHDTDMNMLSGTVIRSGKSILKNYKGGYTLFAIMDELTCIFMQPQEAAEFFAEDTTETLVSLFSARLSMTVSESIQAHNPDSSVPGYIFRGTTWYTDDAEKEIGLRKLCGYATAMEYFAREHFPIAECRGKNYKETESMIKNAGLWDEFNLLPGSYAHGFLYRHAPLKETTVTDDYISQMLS